MPLKKLLAIAILLFLVIGVSSAQTIQKVGIVSIQSSADDEILQDLSRVVTGFIEMTLGQFPKYQIEKTDYIDPQNDMEDSKVFLNQYEFDYLIYGNSQVSEEGFYTFDVSLYDTASDSVAIHEEASTDSIMDVFDIADGLIITLLEKFTDTEISFGTLSIINEIEGLEYSLYLNSGYMGDNLRDTRVLTGNHRVDIFRKEGDSIVLLKSQSVSIEEGRVASIFLEQPRATESVDESNIDGEVLLENAFQSAGNGKPRIYVAPISSSRVSDQDKQIMEHVFISKLLISNQFEVWSYDDVERILTEMEVSEDFSDKDVMALLNADFLFKSTYEKKRSKILVDVNVFKGDSNLVLAHAGREIENLDLVDSAMVEIGSEIIESMFHISNWNYSVFTSGISYEITGYVALMDPSSPLFTGEETTGMVRGGGFTLGATGQEGDAALGFYTKWGAANGGLLCNFGGMQFVSGNKVEGFAWTIGAGAGMGGNGGLIVSPSAGIFFRNVFLRYMLDLDVFGVDESKMIHNIEIGYSIFTGSVGKEPTSFK